MTIIIISWVRKEAQTQLETEPVNLTTTVAKWDATD